jgi:class 3 adenylate cyclase
VSRPQRTTTVESASFPGEQRQATALCLSLNVLAVSAQCPDPETLDAILRDQLNLCADVATRFGAQVVGALGNRLMAVFGLPHAADDDPRRAGLGALELASRIESRRPLLVHQRGIDLELRIGVHTDVVIVGPDGSASGPALNVAARLEGLADAGVTLVSEATRDLVFKHLHLRALAVNAFAGTPAAIRLYSLVSAGTGGPLAAASLAPEPAELIGRDDEMHALFEHWKAAQGGAGRVILLRGEPGMGKSRAVHVCRSRADA